jgi:putative transposase
MAIKATKVRIYPTPEQAHFLNAQFGAVRFAYNKALYVMSERFKRHGDKLSAKHDIKKLLPVAKRSRKYHWMKDYDSVSLQQSCINLDTAFKKFFDKKLPNRYPNFKRKHGKASSYHTGVKVTGDSIKIPKCEPIKARIHREIEGIVKSITLSRTSTGKYFASILVDDGVEAPKLIDNIDARKITGIDLGLTHIAIESNGRKVANPRFIKRAADNLKRKQRSLSRKRKGSRSRNKARILVAKCHEKTANARNDFQHKLSKRLIDENQAVIVETLKVKNMIKNHCLAKHIADASWSTLVKRLEYKAKDQGKHLVKINQWFASTKTCSCCGHKVDKMKLDVRSWDCSECNTHHDRDINAAINIKNRGITDLMAEGLSVTANGGLHKTS